MKKIYLFALSLLCFYGVAQQTISFESSEGYQLGNIDGQNGWTVTETSDGPLTNQVISDTYAKSGMYSFKNAHVSQYQDQWYPIFGIAKSFTPALDYKTTTISYDFFAPEQGGSDFEFAVFSINEEEEVFDTILAVGFENRGYIYLYPEVNFGGFMYANPHWSPNTWYNMKIEFSEDKIQYFIDDFLIYESPNNAKLNIDGINFLHNNFGGDAYYDNIKINNRTLAIENVNASVAKIYPNPVVDLLHILLPQGEMLERIEVYAISGERIFSAKTEKVVNLENLKSGIYLVKARNTNGKVYTSKIVKR